MVFCCLIILYFKFQIASHFTRRELQTVGDGVDDGDDGVNDDDFDDDDGRGLAGTSQAEEVIMMHWIAPQCGIQIVHAWLETDSVFSFDSFIVSPGRRSPFDDDAIDSEWRYE